MNTSSGHPQQNKKLMLGLLLPLSYLVLAVLYTWPLARYFRSAVPGDNGDATVNLWPFWYIPRALVTPGWSFFHSRLMFWPDGIDLIFHSNSMVGAFLMAPVALSIGAAAACNTWLLLNITCTGLFFYLFCRTIRLQPIAAWVAGALLMACPFTTTHLPGHYSLLQSAAVPGSLFLIARMTKLLILRRSVSRSRLAILVFGLALLWWILIVTDFYIGVMGAILNGALFLILGAQYRNRIQWKALMFALLAATGGAAALTLPWIRALVDARSQGGYQNGTNWMASELTVHWRNLLTFPPYHPVWGPLIYGDRAGPATSMEHAFLGTAPFGLALCGFIFLPKRIRLLPWLLLALFAVGMMGCNGETKNPQYPTGLLAFGQLWPTGFPLGQFRVPARWHYLLCVSVTVLAGYGLQGIFLRFTRQKYVICALAVAYSALDLTTNPLPLYSVKPAHWTAIPLVGEGALLEFPLGFKDGQGSAAGTFDSQQLVNQMAHGKPLLSAYVSRLPHIKSFSRRADASFMAAAEGAPDEIISWRNLIKRYQIKWVVLNRSDNGTNSRMKSLEKTFPEGHWLQAPDAEIFFLP